MLPKFLKTNKYKLSIDTMSDFEKIKKLLVIYGKKPISIKKILKILKKILVSLLNIVKKILVFIIEY